MTLAERADELARQVIAPVALGGPIAPTRPFGPKLALEVAQSASIFDDELRLEIDAARVRRARSIVAVDVLPEVRWPEWAMAAALNDLLQVTNEELSSFATRSRHDELLTATAELCATIPPPTTLWAALARHATFARLLHLTRTDHHVSWWTGSTVFRGQVPPARLSRWPSLRRVKTERTRVPLVEMAVGVPANPSTYLEVVGALLACSPLTDLAWADRPSPPFRWTRGTLATIGTIAGGNLALRAFRQREASTKVWQRQRGPWSAAAIENMDKAMAHLPEGSQPRKLASHHVAVLRAAATTWT